MGALLRNIAPQFMAEAQPGRILARRVHQLADELGFDRARVRGWGLAQAVLSAWWSVEDHGHGWEWAKIDYAGNTQVIPNRRRCLRF